MVDPTSHTNTPIRLRLFAGLREQAGWAERAWPAQGAAMHRDHPSGKPLTPREIWVALGLEGGFDTVRVAINHHFAGPDTPLQPGDELAFLPPISGG